MQSSNTTDSGVSTGVATKKLLKPEVNKTLRALRCVLRANYPRYLRGEIPGVGIAEGGLLRGIRLENE